MRPLIVQVPQGKGNDVLAFARDVKAKNICMWTSTDEERTLDVVMAFISNKNVGPFIDSVNAVEDVQITLFPQGVMAMYPPQSEAADQVTNVQVRSPIEIFLAGLQSIGSWTGFLSYAVLGAIIVWIGLFTNTTFLLVGAMLVAPFAGPAMNTAIATARGDKMLLGRSLLRYFISLLLTILATFLLSLFFQQEGATSLMVERSQVSSTAILLALAAGCAGAISLVQSERSGLVSGAAAGMLVAASLAPPAGVLGMAMAVGEWQMVKSVLFVLMLQLVGINLSGSLIFRAYGLKAEGPRFSRGKSHVFIISLAVTILFMGALTWWQFRKEPELQRSSIAKRAETEIQQLVNRYGGAGLVEGTARFTRADISGQNTLLCVVYVQAKNGTSEENIKTELTRQLLQTLNQKFINVTPVVSVIVMKDWQAINSDP